MKTIIKFAAFAALAVVAVSCKKESKPKANGECHIEMEYVWSMNNLPFTLNKTLYHPMTKDSLNFKTFKHYISNIKLHNVDGTIWTDQESYYLVDLSNPSSMKIHLTNVPEGEYDRIEFTLGVDSLRNVSGVQSGALDPVNNMFWSWSSGYIMIKAEGIFQKGNFSYHLGGFSGLNKAITQKNLAFPNGELLKINANASPVIHMKSNPAKLFHTHGSAEGAGGSKIHMPGSAATVMAQDFNSSVQIDHLHN
jgi:hypothetical protein